MVHLAYRKTFDLPANLKREEATQHFLAGSLAEQHQGDDVIDHPIGR
jgi:hypothetical protein